MVHCVVSENLKKTEFRREIEKKNQAHWCTFSMLSKNNNEIILDFIRNQVTPKSISLFDAINILMNDFATQQNVIMELLSEEVKKVFFGENNMVATTDVAEARLLSFSLLGGEILDAKDKLLFFQAVVVLFSIL